MTKEPLNKSSLERILGKIGMISRRTTKIVSMVYDAKE